MNLKGKAELNLLRNKVRVLFLKLQISQISNCVITQSDKGKEEGVLNFLEKKPLDNNVETCLLSISGIGQDLL